MRPVGATSLQSIVRRDGEAIECSESIVSRRDNATVQWNTGCGKTLRIYAERINTKGKTRRTLGKNVGENLGNDDVACCVGASWRVGIL